VYYIVILIFSKNSSKTTFVKYKTNDLIGITEIIRNKKNTKNIEFIKNRIYKYRIFLYTKYIIYYLFRIIRFILLRVWGAYDEHENGKQFRLLIAHIVFWPYLGVRN